MIPPQDAPNLWDRIRLGGVWSPGTVTLAGHDRVIGWDKKEGSGTDGGTTTRKGEPIGEFTATFHLVDDPTLGIDDFADWVDFQALVESTINGQEPKALTIEHPDLQRNRFTAVVLASMGAMTLDGLGGGTIVVKFIEYRPPQPKGRSGANSPKKATGDKNKSPGDRAIEEAVAELEYTIAEGENL